MKYELKNQDALRVIAAGLFAEDPFNLGVEYMTSKNIDINVQLIRRPFEDVTGDLVITIVLHDGELLPVHEDDPYSLRSLWSWLWWPIRGSKSNRQLRE